MRAMFVVAAAMLLLAVPAVADENRFGSSRRRAWKRSKPIALLVTAWTTSR